MNNESFITVLLLCIGIGFILLFFGGCGGWVLYLGLSDKKKAAASKGWLSVPGKIISSQIKEVIHHDSDGMQVSLQLAAEYEYSVDGIQYINNKHTPSRIPKGIPYRKVAEVSNRYAVGVIIPVYYNPANPQESCLEREAPLGNLTTIVGIVLLVIAACGLCVFGTLLVNANRYMTSGQ